MSKRRTRKQKELAKHPFLVSWTPPSIKQKSEAKVSHFEANVNRQKEIDPITKVQQDLKTKHSDNSVQILDLASIKKDLVKSLILAAFVLASELMLYLIWNVKR